MYLFDKEIIVRNLCVRGMCCRPEETLDCYLAEIPSKGKDELLQDRMKEQYGFLELEKEYFRVQNKNYKGDIFSKLNLIKYTSKRKNRYGIQLTHKILIYTLTDLDCQRELYDFAWLYPNCIAALGTPEQYTLNEIAQDFLQLPFLRFYVKYVLHQDLENIYDIPQPIAENTYALTDTLGVAFDWHIKFFNRSHDVNTHKTNSVFIADTWYYEDEEILHDLLNLPTVTFGERYHTTWV